MKYEELPLAINSDRHRFELAIEGHTAFITFDLDGKTIELIHTEVPSELGGKGVGPAIAEKALEYAKSHGYSVIPSCPFIQSYVKRHPEWEAIVAREF